MHRGERKSGSGVYWTLLLSLLLHLAALLYKMNTRLHTSTAPIPDALIELSEIPPSLEPSQESKPPKTAKIKWLRLKMQTIVRWIPMPLF